MPGKRGPSEKRPIGDLSELAPREMALEMHIPRTQFIREYEEGLYDGAYRLRGGHPYFIVHLMKKIQELQAAESAKTRRLAA